jgi:hypothetical protein
LQSASPQPGGLPRSSSDANSTPRGEKLLQPQTQAQNGQPRRTATTSSWLFGYNTPLVASKPGGGGCQRGYFGKMLRRQKGQIYDRKKVRNKTNWRDIRLSLGGS